MAHPDNTVFLPQLPTELFKTSYLEYRPTKKEGKTDERRAFNFSFCSMDFQFSKLISSNDQKIEKGELLL